MIVRGNVFSKVLEMDTGITVVVPNRFRSGKPYKVVYLLHGLCGDSGSWTDNTMLPVYANEQDIVFIMPQVSRSLYTDMKYGQRFFTYVADELPVICKSVFNISAERKDTTIMGASMGGYGALKCALSRPQQYGFCFAFSSACLFLKEGLEYQQQTGQTAELRKIFGQQLLIDFKAIFGEELTWKPEDDVLELAKQIKDFSRQPAIYSFCGTKDSLREDNAKFAEQMKAIRFNFRYEEWEGDHDWFFFDKTLKHAISILKENYHKTIER